MSSRNRGAKNERTAAVKPVSRRMLLRGSVAAMPAILTLQSGAALARSSNLLNAAKNPPPDAKGRTLCVDTSSVIPVDGTTYQYDMGDPPHAMLYAINDRQHKNAPYKIAEDIGEKRMCINGGTYYFRDTYNQWSHVGTPVRGKWRQVDVPRGFLMSATAVTSMAAGMNIMDM